MQVAIRFGFQLTLSQARRSVETAPQVSLVSSSDSLRLWGTWNMSTDAGPSVSELLPTETWALLKEDSDAVLVDVRSKPELGFVGKPDLSALGHTMLCVEWASYPGMSANARFVEEVLHELDGAVPSVMLFLCRSGVRSIGSARAMTKCFAEQGRTVECISVAEGFEGDLNAQKHRGDLNGWKVRGLPWVQS